MPDHDFIDAQSFTFATFPHPLHPDEVGDSGILELAASKYDPSEQYIVKSGYPELGCNEFMYHKVAATLGLYTQNVSLVHGNKKYHRAAAIRYVPNAQEFNLKTSSVENFQAHFEFEALYVILNESDSHEYYLDDQGRLFKLDNAASFTVGETTIRWFDGDPIGRFFIPDINAPLNAVGYDMYGIALKTITKNYGKDAAATYLSIMKRFIQFDESVLAEAYTALDEQYPTMLKSYYQKCIQIRKQTCRRFLNEIGMDS